MAFFIDTMGELGTIHLL